VRFKLDENLGRSAINALESEGYDVSSIHLQNMDGADDRKVFDICLVEDRTLVTLDTDFANPLNFDPRGTAGVAVLRLPKDAGPTDLQRELGTLITGLRDHPIAASLWIVKSGRIRIWKPRP
jgi:Domain of unknown function (DUF5615)